MSWRRIFVAGVAAIASVLGTAALAAAPAGGYTCWHGFIRIVADVGFNFW